MNNSEKRYIKIKSGARLHIQVIDPMGISGFKLGGIGLALKSPSVEVIVTESENITESGFKHDSKYIQEISLEKQELIDLKKFHVFIKSEIPEHVGFGSGTICRTLVRKALQEISKTKEDIFNLSSLTGVGQYAVLNGGLVLVSPVPKNSSIPDEVLEGGLQNRIQPNLLSTLKIPSNWQVILCIPKNKHIHDLYGEIENKFYENLLPPKIEELHLISFEILSRLIPSVINNDFDKFEEALGIITNLGWKKDERKLFEDYWNKTSNALYDIGAKFAATTSSGPTTYTIVDANNVNIKEIKSRLEQALENDCEVIVSEVNNLGSEILNL